MSKKIPAELTCSQCGNKFEINLYRSLWIEFPENLELVLTDKVNVFACPKCRFQQRVDFSLLCTNVKKQFAVWFEPILDPIIDSDQVQYSKAMGPNSYMAKAPRIRDWATFKETIIKLNSGEIPSESQVASETKLGLSLVAETIMNFGKSIWHWKERTRFFSCLGGAVMLLLAMTDMSHAYYQLLRWIVCGVSVYSAHIFYSERPRRTWAVWLLVVTAVIFNPLQPFDLEEDTWAGIDLAAAAILLMAGFLGFRLSPTHETGSGTIKFENFKLDESRGDLHVLNVISAFAWKHGDMNPVQAFRYARLTIFLTRNGNPEEKAAAALTHTNAVKWSIDTGTVSVMWGMQCIGMAVETLRKESDLTLLPDELVAWNRMRDRITQGS